MSRTVRKAVQAVTVAEAMLEHSLKRKDKQPSEKGKRRHMDRIYRRKRDLRVAEENLRLAKLEALILKE